MTAKGSDLNKTWERGRSLAAPCEPSRTPPDHGTSGVSTAQGQPVTTENPMESLGLPIHLPDLVSGFIGILPPNQGGNTPPQSATALGHSVRKKVQKKQPPPP